MSKKRKNPITPEQEISETVNFTQEQLENAIDEVLEQHPLPPLPITSEAGLEMFNEACQKVVSEMLSDEDKEVNEIADGIRKAVDEFDSPLVNKEDYVNFVEEKLGEILEGTSAEKRIDDAIDEALTEADLDYFEDLKIEPVIHDHSTLLEFYQARATVGDADLDFIPFDYVDLDFDTNILKNINFAFMIPFDVIKGGVHYCTVKQDDYIVNENVAGIPSRYDLIDNGTTVQAFFHVNGAYDVKSMFDSTYTVLQSSLFSNHKIAK